MTTVRDQATRDRLAEVLGVAQSQPHSPVLVPRLYPGEIDAIVAALLPVVAELVREGQAEALETAAVELDEYVAHAAKEAREWAPDTHWVTSWEGKQAAYAWSARLHRARAAALRAPRGEATT